MRPQTHNFLEKKPTKDLCSHSGDVERNANALGDALTVDGVHLVEKFALAFLDVLVALAEEAADVLDDGVTVGVAEHLVPKSAGLLVVIIGMLRRVAADSLTLEGLSVPGVSLASRGGGAVH